MPPDREPPADRLARLDEERLRARALELETANAQLEEYRRLVSSVRDYAIFMLDPLGHVRSWNAGAEQLKGYRAEEVVGRHFSLFYTAEERARRHPEEELELATRDGRYEEEGWRVRKDGTLFWAGVTITAVRDDNGRLTGFAKVTRDLSARHEAEEALHRAVDELRSVNAELDRFAAVAAHDLSDPLRTISGFGELLERAGLPPAEHGYARHIRESSQRLTRMLRDLLTYARAGRPIERQGPVDLAGVLGQALDDLGAAIAGAGAEVVADVPPGLTVVATEMDVRLVLQNLVANALKFADAGRPEVRIAVERDEPDDWRVLVEDNGPGVAEADRERIFGAFERATSDEGGYGLGLAICRRLVERHGGRIGVDPAPPGGGRFWFSLPQAAGTAQDADAAGAPARA